MVEYHLPMESENGKLQQPRGLIGNLRVVEDREATKSPDSFVLETRQKRVWVRRGQDIPRWTIDLTTKPRKGTEAKERMVPLLLEALGNEPIYTNIS